MRKVHLSFPVSKFAVLLLFTLLFLTPKAYAAVDSVSTLSSLQSKVDSAMHERKTSYQIVYKGNISTLQQDISNIINKIYNADDYLRYTSKGYYYSYKYSSNMATITFTFNYWNTAQQEKTVNTKVTAILNQIIKPGMNNFEKEKVIHDWIEKHVAYDTSYSKYSAYDALVSPYKTVCQGYALLSYKMLNQAGIKTRIIEGTAGGQSHAWNLVNLDGVWYHFDSTWDDPLPDVAGRVTYDYYNLTDAQIKRDHSWVKTYPAATTDFYNTLNKKLVTDPAKASVYRGLLTALDLNLLSKKYTANNRDELAAMMKEAIKNKQSTIHIRYMNRSTLLNDIATAIKGIPNLSYYSYSYSDYKRTSNITNDVVLNVSFR
ncbi:transglutaminase domain-containing protein [Neobacillus sp. LXY-1]|uniref:transglutaminase domain-containing protein n=1 Tax=Neobacillus sp. LXY-1 TaxID=3379133 RepID=UPI003EE4195D